jgi:hypothetical protein
VTLRCDFIDIIADYPNYLAARRDCPWPPYEGEDVVFVGMLLQVPGQQLNLPIVRKGTVGIVTEERIKHPRYGMGNYHVINLQTYPGNSGGPVWVHYDRADDGTGNHSLYYLGIVAVGFAEIEEMRKLPNTDADYYVNLGVSLVTPIERILEIMNDPKEAARRESFGQNEALPPIVLSALEDDVNESGFSKEDMEEALRKVSRRSTSSQSDEASSGT